MQMTFVEALICMSIHLTNERENSIGCRYSSSGTVALRLSSFNTERLSLSSSQSRSVYQKPLKCTSYTDLYLEQVEHLPHVNRSKLFEQSGLADIIKRTVGKVNLFVCWRQSAFVLRNSMHWLVSVASVLPTNVEWMCTKSDRREVRTADYDRAAFWFVRTRTERERLAAAVCSTTNISE